MTISTLTFKTWTGGSSEKFTYLDWNRLVRNAAILAQACNVPNQPINDVTRADLFSYSQMQLLEDLTSNIAIACGTSYAKDAYWSYGHSISYVDFERVEAGLYAAYVSLGGTGSRVASSTIVAPPNTAIIHVNLSSSIAGLKESRILTAIRGSLTYKAISNALGYAVFYLIESGSYSISLDTLDNVTNSSTVTGTGALGTVNTHSMSTSWTSPTKTITASQSYTIVCKGSYGIQVIGACRDDSGSSGVFALIKGSIYQITIGRVIIPYLAGTDTLFGSLITSESDKRSNNPGSCTITYPTA